MWLAARDRGVLLDVRPWCYRRTRHVADGLAQSAAAFRAASMACINAARRMVDEREEVLRRPVLLGDALQFSGRAAVWLGVNAEQGVAVATGSTFQRH